MEEKLKFNENEKEIIKKINDGKVYDIYSYVREFNLGKEKKYDLKDCEKILEKVEKGKLYKVLTKEAVNKVNQDEQYIATENDYEYLSKQLVNKSEVISVEFNDCQFDYELYHGVYIINSFENLKSFFIIWKYLKDNRLVLEVEKPIYKDELGIFFECKDRKPKIFDEIEKRKKMQGYFEELQKNIEKFISPNPPIMKMISKEKVKQHDAEDNEEDASLYFDYYFEYNYEHQKISSEFIGKKIIPMSSLELFVKEKFRTEEDKREIFNKRMTITSVVVAILSLVIAGVALYVTISQNKDTDMVKLREKVDVVEEQLQSINTTIDSFKNSIVDGQELEKILKQTNELLKGIDAKINIENQ